MHGPTKFFSHPGRSIGSPSFPLAVANLEGRREEVIAVSKTSLGQGNFRATTADGRVFLLHHPNTQYREVARDE